MTVAYNFDFSASTWLSISKVLLRWRGSVWKAVISELIFWFTFYGVVNFCLRTFLNDHQTENFKAVRLELSDCLPRIPLSLLLGFFVNVVFSRWSEIFRKIGFIDNLALIVSTVIEGFDEETRMMKRRIIRYAVLSQSLVFRDISLEVRKRFPDAESIVIAGLMTDHECELIESKLSRNQKYWIPIQWAMQLIWKARKADKICNDVIAFQLIEKLRAFRTDLQMLCCFDWVPVPLAYPQIVFLGVRCYFLITIIAHQTIGKEFIIPWMTVIELVLLLGWVKVAEALLNPLGTDDDDFECNYVIDRNLSLGLEIADGIQMPSPNDVDIFWTMAAPIPLDNAFFRKKIDPYIGSVADVDVNCMEKQSEEETDGLRLKNSVLRQRRLSRQSSQITDAISHFELSTVPEETELSEIDVTSLSSTIPFVSFFNKNFSDGTDLNSKEQ